MRHLAIVLLCVAACASDDPPVDEEVRCDEVTDDDEFVVGLNKVGDNGVGFTIMSGDPAPPIRGDNVWVIELTENASPMTGASILVNPFMPAHGHAAGKPVTVAPEAAPGQYRLSPVNLWMPGVWETTVRVTAPVNDEVIFRFCIPS